MTLPAWDNLDEFVSGDDFAQPVAFTLADGSVLNVNAIFDAPWFDRTIREYALDSEAPRLTCKHTEVIAVHSKDSVVVAGVKYNVKGNPRPDGTGMATVYLAALNAA